MAGGTARPTAQSWTVHARLNLARPHVHTGTDGVCKIDANRFGFSVGGDALEERYVALSPISTAETLAANGAELLNVREELKAEGITEESFDVNSRAHKLTVGRVLMAAAQQRFGPHKRIVHLGDTSRVSGRAGYGEPTVRDTGSTTGARNAHYAAHVDKFLPGIAACAGLAGARAGAERFVSEYWRINGPDWEHEGLSREEVAYSLVADTAAAVNIWVALTPGGVEQAPLAIADTSTLTLGDGSLATVPVNFTIPPDTSNVVLSDTLTLLRAEGVDEGVRWLWRPHMAFGECLLFSTTATPHTAVWLEGQPCARRVSAEIRLLVLDRQADGDSASEELA